MLIHSMDIVLVVTERIAAKRTKN